MNPLIPQIVLAVTGLLCLVCLLQSMRLRRLWSLARKQVEPKGNGGGSPDVSIIVTCQEQQSQLRRLLPTLLSQQYGGQYEVIVVDKLGEKETREWLEDLESRYPHLHHSFCPPTARDISIQRLALSLGAKAANFDWLLFLSAETLLPDDQWLQNFMSCADEGAEAFVGISSYESGYGWLGEKIRWSRLWEQMAWMPYALNHAPYCIHPEMVCYRRSHFLSHHGFASPELLAGGTLELLVNHNVGRGRLRVNLLPEASVKLPLPTLYIWRRERLYNVETRRHLRHSFLPRFAEAMTLLPFPLYTLGTIVSALLFQDNVPVCLALVVMWMAVCVVQWLMLRPTAVAMGLRRAPSLLPLLMLWLPANKLSTWLKWRFTKKDIFRKKFI